MEIICRYFRNRKIDSYTNWAPGQPDHWADASGMSESCVEMWEHTDGKWNDANCHILKEYICEMDRVGQLSKCDNQKGWVEHTINGATTCYWHNQE